MPELRRALAVGTFAVAAAALVRPVCTQPTAAAFRPPAVPLVTSDPYLSIWSEADHLTDDVTRHWTHRPHSLVSLIRIDGKTYRLMGSEPVDTAAFPQVGLQVLPTRSIYDFEDSHVHLRLTFMTPVLPHDLDVLTRPLTYLTWQARSVDGAPHVISIFGGASSQLAVNSPDEKVVWARGRVGSIVSLGVGSVDQPVLQSSGDDRRIDWGYAYLAAPADHTLATIGSAQAIESAFVSDGSLPADDTRMPRAVNDEQPMLAMVMNLGTVTTAPVSRHTMIAYDEVFSIKYLGRKLRPYWRRNGATPADLFRIAERDYLPLTQRCEKFDRALMADLTREGGSRYAQIAALAYRQSLAACGIAADANKQPLLFTKENTSNGDIATVDVIFPMDPVLIFLSPTLAKASIAPILSYAASGHWKFPNAPHDLGTYPIARGTDDGGEGMPVEESGNMLILCDAIAQEEGNARFVSPWWPKLTQWAAYLEKYGSDPEEQLCTDDFMGHIAHNANLSVKAILGLAAYGNLCRLRGDEATADRYQTMARGFAQHWIQAAGDGGHFRLAFDKPNTWSQKYNLVWDRILGLNIFPPVVAQDEVAHYIAVLQPYGVPLDSRTHLTKTDWSVWSATLASNREDFETLISPIYNYLSHTTARLPLVDSYVTDNIKSDGMHARPVVGGIFIKMLADRAMWNKWSRGDLTKVGKWAPLPPSPRITEVVATSRALPVLWRYSTEQPAANWFGAGFDDSHWKQGPAGFGTNPPGGADRTTWNTGDIWLRRVFTMPVGRYPNLQLFGYHDEDVEVYFNGVLAGTEGGFTTSYGPIEIRPAARAALTPGDSITMAVHCHQTEGGQGIDMGLANVVQP